MPEISRFFGIIVKMYFDKKEHNPPHIHAIYNEFEIEINIKTMKIMNGKLPNREFILLIKWLEKHQVELLEMVYAKIYKNKIIRKGVSKMKKIPLMKEVEPQNDMILKVKFENGVTKLIDIKQYINIFKPFKKLKNKDLFSQAKLDVGGYGIVWNEEIDLGRYAIWEDGKTI